MGIIVYLSQHPVFEAQRESNYEKKFVVNRIKEINRQIGTGYTKVLNRLLEENTVVALDKYQQNKDDAITKEVILQHVIKEAKAVKWRLNDCWTRQLIEQNKPLENLTNESVPQIHSQNQQLNLSSHISIYSIRNNQYLIQYPKMSEVSEMSAGVEDLEARIAELYRLIQETEKPGEFRQNHKSGQVKPFRARPQDRAQVRRWKAELEVLTRRQHDRVEAARIYQQEQERTNNREG